MTRKECLDKAAECVLKDRASQYGGMEDNFRIIAKFWSVYLDRDVYPVDVAAMMALLKIARARSNPGHGDSWIDLAGYAACGAECAGIGTEVPPWAKLVGKEAEEVEKAFGKPDGGCCQNGKDQPKFKEGEAVQYTYKDPSSPEARWLDAWYVQPFVKKGEHVLNRGGMNHFVHDEGRIRSKPREAEGCEEPEFKCGDRVQFRDEIPSTSEPHWFEGVYVERLSDGGHAVAFGPHDHVIHCSDKDIRRVPKAEGCEALVEQDAPQTPDELCQRIVDCNPATFGRPRKPTGEELAEMAEEEEKHG